MKKLTTLLTLMAGLGLSFGQAVVHQPGTVSFQNTETTRTTGNASYHLITNSTTPGVGLVGTQYKAELYYMDTTLNSLQPIPTSISSFRDSTVTIAKGTWIGPSGALFLPAGYGGVDIDNTTGTEAGSEAPGFTSPNGDGLYPVQLEVFVWDGSTGATYETANPALRMHSALFSYTQRASSAPPATSDNQTIAQPGFILPVPEPSAIALSIMGVAGLLFIRRRKN